MSEILETQKEDHPDGLIKPRSPIVLTLSLKMPFVRVGGAEVPLNQYMRQLQKDLPK